MVLTNKASSVDEIRYKRRSSEEREKRTTSDKFTEFIKNFRLRNPDSTTKPDATIGGICPIGSITESDIKSLKE